jgi:hypothetical protein
MALAPGAGPAPRPLKKTITCQHLSIHWKVAAYHKSPHSRILSSQPVRIVGEIVSVFSSIHKHKAIIASGCSALCINRVSPASATAQSCTYISTV